MYLITLVFTMVSGVLLLVVGRVSDIVGRRYFMLVGCVLSCVGSIVCARSTSVNMLIGGTTIVGLSAAIPSLYPLLIQELVPNKYRGWAQGGIVLGVLPAMAFGPAIARALVAHTSQSWR